MTTSLIGYPRIGAKRELKFAIEKFFKKECNKPRFALYSNSAPTLVAFVAFLKLKFLVHAPKVS